MMRDMAWRSSRLGGLMSFGSCLHTYMRKACIDIIHVFYASQRGVRRRQRRSMMS
jgi:hypothetical protein